MEISKEKRWELKGFAMFVASKILLAYEEDEDFHKDIDKTLKADVSVNWKSIALMYSTADVAEQLIDNWYVEPAWDIDWR